MRKALRRPLAVIVAVASALALTTLTGVHSASAVNLALPSLWQSYQDDFTVGTFGGWSSSQALYDYRSNSLPNELKLDSQIGTSNTNSLSRQTYVAAVNQINADPTLDDAAKAAATEQANENIVLQPTTNANQAEGILKAIEAYNAANNLPEDQKKIVRAHVLAWHGGQQPNWFFSNGFVYNAASPDWASPATMLKRLDNYIHLMMTKYAKYSDIIVSWDVVNEAVDDFSGQIRNGDTAQVSQWGRIFRRPDLDGDPDARLYAESAWVRQAFESARTWSNAVGATWKLYYNDYQDSDKPYEPKMSQTIKMLKPIHEAGNIDGYGMQGRLAYAYPSIGQLKTQIDAGLTVANEISITEGDIRSDFEPNPDYDPTQPSRPVTATDGADPAHQWPTYGSCSWTNRAAANGNTFDVCNSPVRRIPAWGTGSNDALANSPAIMTKQADFAADWMDLLLSYKGKIVIDDWDGTSDANTFNRSDGAQLWSGQAGNAEKYSFFSVLGAPAREKMRDAITKADALDQHGYTAESWQRVADARTAAAALVNVRIYSIDGVNAVKGATTTLTDAISNLERPPAPTIDSVSVVDGAKVSGTATFTVSLGATSDVSYTYIELNRNGVWLTDNTKAPGSHNNGLNPNLVVDTTAYPNGTYQLKIDAVSVGGNTAEKTVSFAINNPPTWDASKVYVADNQTTYQGSIWQALWWTQNQTPGDPNGPWEQIASASDGTAVWTASRIFVAGDRAVYQGVAYQAQWWTRNQAPGDPNGPWKRAG